MDDYEKGKVEEMVKKRPSSLQARDEVREACGSASTCQRDANSYDLVSSSTPTDEVAEEEHEEVKERRENSPQRDSGSGKYCCCSK